MTVDILQGQRCSTTTSKYVNVFDLTSKAKENSDATEISSAKERAARITLCVILTMVTITAVSLLLGEAFGLQWTLCSKPHNKTVQDSRYHWPWNWKPDTPFLTPSESYQEHWNSLSLPQKRKELFRATFGEVDLYDMYDAAKDSHPVNSDEKI
uniref:Uncharacterized protein n=1 Tax=Graphocephala atropunctata TaxID=36148 RepID=A0A1B6LG38_9HEMI